MYSHEIETSVFSSVSVTHTKVVGLLAMQAGDGWPDSASAIRFSICLLRPFHDFGEARFIPGVGSVPLLLLVCMEKLMFDCSLSWHFFALVLRLKESDFSTRRDQEPTILNDEGCYGQSRNYNGS